MKNVLYRLKQGKDYFLANLTKEDLNLALRYLNGEEKKLFLEMNKYDQVHSINLLKKVLENDLLKNNFTYIKLSLLHDLGKENISFVDRLKVVIGKKQDIHCEKSYEKLYKIDKDLAILAKEHKDINTCNTKLKEFQKLDNES